MLWRCVFMSWDRNTAPWRLMNFPWQRSEQPLIRRYNGSQLQHEKAHRWLCHWTKQNTWRCNTPKEQSIPNKHPSAGQRCPPHPGACRAPGTRCALAQARKAAGTPCAHGRVKFANAACCEARRAGRCHLQEHPCGRGNSATSDA